MSKEMTDGQLSHLLKWLRDKKVSEMQFTKAIESGILPDFFEALANGTLPSRDAFRRMIGLETETILESLSLKSLITAGNYDWADSDITEVNFPVPADFKLDPETRIFHFDHDISSENVIAMMKLEEWRPAQILDLLDFGAKNPELQRQYAVVALCSVCEIDGERRVTCLDGDGSQRILDLYWFDGDWDDGCRFLAVRNN